MTDIVYLNGDFVSKASAKISVLDRGFLFGDGIYEVIPVYKGQAFRLSEHLRRLDASLKAIRLANPYKAAQWQSLIDQVIAKSGQQHLSIYIQISRGCQEQRNHLAGDSLEPTVLIMPGPLSTDVAELRPIKAALLEDIRWQYCHIKSVSLLANILLRQEAESQGCQEAILHRGNMLTEGATSNIFLVKNNEIHTPKKNRYILGGITRDLIIELAEKAGIKVQQRDIEVPELLQADEAWVSSSSREISPVTQINDKIVSSGTIGPVTKAIHSAFQSFKQALIND